jgi:hypothetical protein
LGAEQAEVYDVDSKGTIVDTILGCMMFNPTDELDDSDEDNEASGS